VDPAPAHVHGVDHPADKPIGWWLKHVDRLIEATLDRVLAGEGIGRRHWQALNAIAGGADSAEAVDEALAPFRGSGPALRVVLDQLRAQHWTQEVEGRITLTPTGSAARGRLIVAVREARARTTEGIDEQEYRTTLDVLARMARNLG